LYSVPVVKISKNMFLIYPALFFTTKHRGNAHVGEFSPKFVEIFWPANEPDVNIIIEEIEYLVFRHLPYRLLSAFGLRTIEPTKIARRACNKLGEDSIEELMEYQHGLPAYYFI